MQQFNVYRNINPDSKEYIPYLLDVQSDLLEILRTRVVVPLEQGSSIKAVETLNPIFSIEDNLVIMSTPELAGVHESNLGELVCSLASQRNEIIAALDMLFLGY